MRSIEPIQQANKKNYTCTVKTAHKKLFSFLFKTSTPQAKIETDSLTYLASDNCKIFVKRPTKERLRRSLSDGPLSAMAESEQVPEGMELRCSAQQRISMNDFGHNLCGYKNRILTSDGGLSKGWQSISRAWNLAHACPPAGELQLHCHGGEPVPASQPHHRPRRQLQHTRTAIRLLVLVPNARAPSWHVLWAGDRPSCIKPLKCFTFGK